MIWNKSRKKFVAVIAACIAILLLSGFVSQAVWTSKQEGVHQIAEIAREIGLPEDDPIIVRAKIIWWEEESSKEGINTASLKSTPEPDAIDEEFLKHRLAELEEQYANPEKPQVLDTFETAKPVVDTEPETEPELLDVPSDEPEPGDHSEDMQEDERTLFGLTMDEYRDLAVKKYTKGILNYTQQDIDIIACVVFNEAGYKTTERHKELVAAVIVNRVNSPWLGDSVYEVVRWPSQYLKAYTDYNDKYMKAAMASEDWDHLCEIAEKALRGEVDIPYDVIFQAEFTQGRGIYELGETYYSTTYFCYSEYPFDDPMLEE